MKSIACAIALLAIGCGQGSQSLSPAAPSALTSRAALADSSTGVAATGFDLIAQDKGGNGKGSDKGQGGNASGPGNGVLSAFVTSVASNSLVVRGITVIVDAGTRIRHGNRTLTLADIHAGDHVQVRGRSDGPNIIASEIKVEHTGDDGEDDGDDDNNNELVGTVAGISGSDGCPTRTFTINNTTVRTNASTGFENVTCSSLANGALVEVEGIRQADGSVLATEIEASEHHPDVDGKISDLGNTTSCPTLTFKVGNTTVTTSAATTFSGIACTSLTNGTEVEVEGPRQGNGSIAATIVRLD